MEDPERPQSHLAQQPGGSRCVRWNLCASSEPPKTARVSRCKSRGPYVIRSPSSVISMTCFHWHFSTLSSLTTPDSLLFQSQGLCFRFPFPEMLCSQTPEGMRFHFPQVFTHTSPSQWSVPFKFVVKCNKGKLILLLKKIHFFLWKRFVKMIGNFITY